MKKDVIICVDDEQVILNSLNKQLQRRFGERFELEFAEGAAEALEIIEELKEEGLTCAMVISDQIMPGMGGDQFLVKLHETHPRIIKILLTGQAALDSAIHAVNEADLFRYLTKPWDEQDFLLTVEKGLNAFYLTRTLEKQVEELERLNRTKDEFLANTSHELRTPLNGMVGLAESLIEGVAGKLPKKAKSDLALIVSGSRRLAGLIDDILDFSKLRHHDLTLVKKAVDPRSLTNVVLTFCKSLVGTKQVVLVNDIPKGVAAVEADENRLQQILFNLVGNAIKFTHEGQVRVSSREKDNLLQIIVEDTGIGINPEVQPTIFDTFVQGDGATSRRYGGTGLGLAITQRLVGLHGGKIWVDSEKGRGSTFTFTLPISILKPLASTEDDALTRIRLYESYGDHDSDYIANNLNENAHNILVVDDEPLNLRVLMNHLSMENYTVARASNGPEALRLLEGDRRYDLVLLDIMMPEMSGYEVCGKIRETWPVHELPVIFLTAKNRTVDLASGFAAGGNDYLVKPFSRSELLYRVKMHLEILESNRGLEKLVIERTQELASRNTELESLDDIVRSINRETELQEVFRAILHYGMTLFPGTEMAGLMLWDQRRDCFNLSFATDERLQKHVGNLGISYDYAVDRYMNKADEIGEHVYLTRKPGKLLTSGMAKIPVAECLLAVPLDLEQRGQIAAFLLLVNYTDSNAFENSDVNKLTRFRAHAVTALAKAELLQELRAINQQVFESIEYAVNLQRAVLPRRSDVKQWMPDSFFIFKPRDMVSGDFFWFTQRQGVIFFIVVDCTGHGVPGAFMSLIGSNLLNRAIIELGITSPAEILQSLHEGIRRTLNQDKRKQPMDGMDVLLCRLELETGVLTFAGAKRPLYLIRAPAAGGGKPRLCETRGDKHSVGGRQREEQRNFKEHSFKVGKGDMIYLATDGFADQPNPHGKKYGSMRLKSFLLANAHRPIKEQEKFLLTELENHSETAAQRDDITVFGVRVS